MKEPIESGKLTNYRLQLLVTGYWTGATDRVLSTDLLWNDAVHLLKRKSILHHRLVKLVRTALNQN